MSINTKNPKFVYAQSSDIKARTYLEYKKDMKKKAIVELEIKDWLQEKLKYYFKTNNLIVEKYWGDHFLWFLRNWKITREPDFAVYINNEKKLFIELQYADREDLKYYDFKISKVAKKIKGKRIPYPDRLFLYIMKNSYRYAFISPQQIIKNAKIWVVPAWWNREAYRLPKETLESMLQKDDKLIYVIKSIDAKIFLLDFQHQLLDIWEENLSNELQKSIDEEKIIKIIPKNIESFFKICFILDHINKIPKNKNLWLIYLLSYISTSLSLKDIAMITYSIDFLYSKIESLKDNEISLLENNILTLLDIINGYYDYKEYLYKSSIIEGPFEETRYAIFSINLLEDIIQELIYYYWSKKLKPIKKIYQNIPNYINIYEKIKINYQS